MGYPNSQETGRRSRQQVRQRSLNVDASQDPDAESQCDWEQRALHVCALGGGLIIFCGANSEHKESQPRRRAWPGQFHVDSKSKTVLQTVLAGDNELQAKGAA